MQASNCILNLMVVFFKNVFCLSRSAADMWRKNIKGELQNGENYKTSKTTERQNTKRRILQNA